MLDSGWLGFLIFMGFASVVIMIVLEAWRDKHQ